MGRRTSGCGRPTSEPRSSAHTLTGYELFVQIADLDKLGTKLVELFPERKFAP
jgi:hypothetical protein